MILAGPSIRVDHLRAGDAEPAGLPNGRPETGASLRHRREPALGNLIKGGKTAIAAMRGLPQSPMASHAEVIPPIETGRPLNIGHVDAHPIAATRSPLSTTPWTRAAARRINPLSQG